MYVWYILMGCNLPNITLHEGWGKRILVLRNDQLSTKKHCRTHDWPKERRKINRNFSLSIHWRYMESFEIEIFIYVLCAKCPWFHHYTGSFYDLNLSKTTEKKGCLTTPQPIGSPDVSMITTGQRPSPKGSNGWSASIMAPSTSTVDVAGKFDPLQATSISYTWGKRKIINSKVTSIVGDGVGFRVFVGDDDDDDDDDGNDHSLSVPWFSLLYTAGNLRFNRVAWPLRRRGNPLASWHSPRPSLPYPAVWNPWFSDGSLNNQ